MSCAEITKNMSAIKGEIRGILLNADKINDNKNYVHFRNYTKWEVKDYGKDVTKCINCAGLESVKGMGACHLGCNVGDNKLECIVMNENGMCNVCGCPHNSHINSRDYYVQVTY